MPLHATDYDPTRSISFTQSATSEDVERADPKFWGPILEAATPLMDDVIRENIHSTGEDDPLEFLLTYMAAHHDAHGSHFEWV